jgi:AcrR family transcriptional regulator
VSSQRNILDAAADQVAEVGLRRTTLTDVARRAGVSRMTVYREYGDADTLFRALLTREITDLIAGVDADVAGLTTARARLVHAAGLIVERMTTHTVFRRVLELDPELLLPLVVDRLGSGQRLGMAKIAGAIKEGYADGSIRTLNADAASYVIQLTVQSFLFSARITEHESDPSSIVAELRAMLDRYVAPVMAAPGTAAP